MSFEMSAISKEIQSYKKINFCNNEFAYDKNFSIEISLMCD